MHTTVFYHGNCPDGYAAALACWMQFGEDAQYLPVNYGQAVPEIPVDHRVMIVDFSYPQETLLALLAARVAQGKAAEPYVVVLDHHASAQRDLQAVQRQNLRGLRIIFDMAESGATLTWKYLQTRGFLPEPSHQPDVWAAVEAAMPRFYAYIRDRDLWQWRLPFSKEVSLALWTEARTFARWAVFADLMEDEAGWSSILTTGMAIRRYSERLVEEQANRHTWGVIGGYHVPIVNTTTLFSEVGDYLCTTQPGIAFCAYYYDRNDGQRQWGLRGHGKVDLSVIAKALGGGGHHDAAGFVTAGGWMFPPREEENIHVP